MKIHSSGYRSVRYLAKDTNQERRFTRRPLEWTCVEKGLEQKDIQRNKDAMGSGIMAERYFSVVSKAIKNTIPIICTPGSRFPPMRKIAGSIPRGR